MLRLITLGLALGLAQPATAQEFEPMAPRDQVWGVDGEPTQIAVLGTMHLRNLDPFDPDWAGPVVDRLAEWEPDLILIEQLPAGELAMMQADPAYADTLASFGERAITLSEAAQASLGISRPEARDQLATDYDPGTGAAGRRQRAALHLADMDPVSALVQWLYLSEAGQIAADGLTAELVEALEREAARQNETTLFAADLAHRRGLDRAFPFDSHADKAGFLADIETIMTAFSQSQVMTETMSGEAMAQMQAPTQGIDSADALLEALRTINSSEHAALDVQVQWSSFTGADMNGLGRSRVAYWEARNLRMAAHAREIMARYPGSRVLIIVGSSHKAFLDDILARSMDVEIVDSQSLLD
ncbi:DUF5694 domain-containing protein [Maricaulis parjimensis]|uniref:DUF5694 domain-containing protein n=1 Tax=Maricaulis parjimensis TaxID=144023 RepID=UPI0019392F16|nr:DUF5694 domain-containing protein [Maricaulis parjimensis]